MLTRQCPLVGKPPATPAAFESTGDGRTPSDYRRETCGKDVHTAAARWIRGRLSTAEPVMSTPALAAFLYTGSQPDSPALSRRTLPYAPTTLHAHVHGRSVIAGRGYGRGRW